MPLVTRPASAPSRRLRAAGRAMPVLVLLLAGCAGTPLPQPDVALPAHWSQAAEDGTPAVPAVDLQHWWTAFDDPLLGNLVTQALRDNPGVAEAGARLRAARLLVGHAGDNYLPQLRFLAQSAQSTDALDAYFQYGLDATWELGLFGRREAQERLAKADLDTAQSQVDAARVSVVAEVTRNYVELRTAQAQLPLLSAEAALAAERQTLLAKRQALGLGTLQAVTDAAGHQADAEQALDEGRQAMTLAAQRLALLTGQARPEPAWLTPAPPPVLRAVTLDSVPADLLRTRPEIRSAEAAILSAAGEAGLARAQMYPYIALTGGYIYSKNLTENFTFEGPLHSSPAFGPVIDLPLFDWGRRRAVSQARQASLEASVHAYRQAVLAGVADTEAALTQFDTQRRRVRRQTALLEGLSQKNTRQQQLVTLGLSSPLAALDDRQRELEGQRNLLDAHAGEALAFIALYKALGGTLPPGEASHTPGAGS